jgi:hypothetical protein
MKVTGIRYAGHDQPQKDQVGARTVVDIRIKQEVFESECVQGFPACTGSAAATALAFASITRAAWFGKSVQPDKVAFRRRFKQHSDPARVAETRH